MSSNNRLKSIQIRILLANSNAECKGACPEVPMVPSPCKYPLNSKEMQAAIGSPWPFFLWRLDILGLFSKATESKKYVIMAVDHFSKWVEAKAI